MVKPSRSAWRRIASIQRRSTWKVMRSVSWVVSLACSRVVFQNLRQVSALFGPDSPFLASFGAMLHYRPAATDLTTAQFISTLTGQTTVLAPSVTSTLSTRSGLHGGQTQGQTWGASATGRPLLTPDEVLRLDDDAALVFLEGLPPIAGRKVGSVRIPAMVHLQQWASAHRETAAGLAVAALLVLALTPLWQYPPSRPVAQTTPPTALASVTPPAAPAPAETHNAHEFVSHTRQPTPP